MQDASSPPDLPIQPETNLWQEIVAHLPEAIVVLDSAGKVIFNNPAATTLLGSPGTGLLGQPFPFTVPLRSVQEVQLPGAGQPLIAEMRGSEIVVDNSACTLVHLRDITEHVKAREGWRRLSLLDEMTGLYNRRGFMTLAEQQMHMADRIDGEVRLLYADFDGLKRINDELGHQQGDQALCDIAAILRTTFRTSDLIARIGGDEFAVLAMGAEGENATTLTRRLQQALVSFNKMDTRPYRLDLSVGIARYSSRSPSSLEELLHRADTLMYLQKREKHGSMLRTPPRSTATLPDFDSSSARFYNRPR